MQFGCHRQAPATYSSTDAHGYARLPIEMTPLSAAIADEFAAKIKAHVCCTVGGILFIAHDYTSWRVIVVLPKAGTPLSERGHSFSADGSLPCCMDTDGKN
jgi:hypothetical protein